MQQTGKVVAASGGKATVRITRTDACGKCDACFRLGGNTADVDIDNPLNAQPGDTVAIELHGGSVLKASVLMYGIPLIGLFAGLLIGSLVSELFAAILGVLCAAGTYFIFRALEPKLSRMSTFKPRMIEILSQGAEQDTKGEQQDG